MAMNRVLCLIIIQWLTLSPLYAFLYNGLDSRLVDKRSTKCQSCGRFAGARLLICLKSNRCDSLRFMLAISCSLKKTYSSLPSEYHCTGFVQSARHYRFLAARADASTRFGEKCSSIFSWAYVGKRTSKSFFGNGNQENYILQLLQEDDNAGLIHRDEENPWYF